MSSTETDNELRESLSHSSASIDLSTFEEEQYTPAGSIPNSEASESVASEDSQGGIPPRDAEEEEMVIEKRFVNGQVLIIIDGIAYDILGRQVSL